MKYAKTALILIFYFLAALSMSVNSVNLYKYYSVEHPTREEQYLELLKDKDIFYGPDGNYFILSPEEEQYCNQNSGCIRLGVDELIMRLNGAYTAGQETKAGNHD